MISNLPWCAWLSLWFNSHSENCVIAQILQYEGKRTPFEPIKEKFECIASSHSLFWLISSLTVTDCIPDQKTKILKIELIVPKRNNLWKLDIKSSTCPIRKMTAFSIHHSRRIKTCIYIQSYSFLLYNFLHISKLSLTLCKLAGKSVVFLMHLGINCGEISPFYKSQRTKSCPISDRCSKNHFLKSVNYFVSFELHTSQDCLRFESHSLNLFLSFSPVFVRPWLGLTLRPSTHSNSFSPWSGRILSKIWSKVLANSDLFVSFGYFFIFCNWSCCLARITSYCVKIIFKMRCKLYQKPRNTKTRSNYERKCKKPQNPKKTKLFFAEGWGAVQGTHEF